MSDTDRRIQGIEARLAEIERRLGIVARTTGGGLQIPAEPTVVPPSPGAPPADIPFATVAPMPAGPKPPPLPAQRPVAAPAPSPAIEAVPYAPRPTQPPPFKHGNIEQTIGLKWAGWIGAVVLVIALGLGLKFAYDQGWFGSVPDSVKLILCWIASLALIAAGELVYRRVNRISATGLFGAGVASLFLVSFAGHGFLKTYDQEVAFWLMSASTVAGALVAMRGRMVSIAVLALIGGNLAPALLGSKDPQAAPLLGYLLGLQVVALFLSWWGGSRRWWALRGFSLATTSFWTLVALAIAAEKNNVDPRGWPTGFVVLFAALFQLELLVSALTGARAGRKPGATFSLLVTAALAAGLMLIHAKSTDSTRAWVLVLVAAACAGLGILCRAMQRSLGRRDEQDDRAHALRALAVSFAVQSAVLLVVAVPVAFSGWAVISGWAALALAFSLIGVTLDLDVPRRAAAVTWALAVAYFAFWLNGHWSEQQARIVLTLRGTPVPQFLPVAIGLSLVGHLITGTIQLRRTDRREFVVWAALVQVIAGVLWAAAAIAALPPAGATLLILIYAWLCAIGDVVRPRLRLAWHAAGAAAVATTKWGVVDVVQQRFSPDWSPSADAVLLNATAGAGLAIAITMLGVWLLRRRQLSADRAGTAWSLILPFGVLAVGTFGLSFEVDRGVQQLAERSGGRMAGRWWAQIEMLSLTMLWTACAAAGAAIVRLVRGPAAWRAAAIFATVTATLLVAKYVLADTLAFRLTGPAAAFAVGANLQMLAGLLLLGLLGLAGWFARAGGPRGGLMAFVGFLAAMLPLWVLSLEIDRWADGRATPWIARHAGWSICWSAYAVLLVIVGLRLRAAAMRYTGLALFAVTLLKVVVIDLSAASTGWRILSFFGLGALLLATSVIYGKISPKLLAEHR